MVGQPADTKDDDDAAEHADDLPLGANKGVLRQRRLANSLSRPENTGHQRQSDDHCQQWNEVKENEKGDVVSNEKEKEKISRLETETAIFPFIKFK